MNQGGFQEAVLALQAGRQRQLRSHCTLEELEAYHRGTLSAGRREEVVEHLTACEDCSILLLYGVIGPNGEEGQAEMSGAEIEDAWQRLRPHLKKNPRPGRSLKSLLPDGPMAPEEALPIAVEISRALVELHVSGRVLQDLRTENVLVSAAGRVHIGDRGWVAHPESFEVEPKSYRSISPEQVAGEGLDARSNLFSFGVLLYEMVTGVSPFQDSTPLGIASRIMALDPVPAAALNPQVEPALSALIDRLLSKEPDERPRSAVEVRHELEFIAAGGGGAESLSRDPGHDIDDQIERLYDEIIALASQEPETGEAVRQEEVGRAYARLRQLQKIASEEFRERFEENLNMPIDAGDEILERTRALREELEGLATPDPATPEADAPTSSTQAR